MSEATLAAAQQLTDFVDLDLARRLEMAETILPDCVAALQSYSPSGPFAALEVGGGVAFFGGTDYPANQMVGLGLYGEVTPQELNQVEEFFHGRGVASTIVLSPMADESLRELLGERGYAIAEFNTVLVKRIGGQEPFSPPEGVSIERVTQETISAWMNAIARGFAQEVSVAEDVFGGFATLPGALAFLARIEGKVVGGCGGRIIPEARLAALFGTATLPEYRCRGVQSALIALRLHEAVKAGCEYAVVSTNPGSGSQRNMQRRGFDVAYTKAVMVRQAPA